MRHETAVSEIIGAILLIAVVIGGMGMVSVLMLSTPPPEKVPKTSMSAYSVACVDDTMYPADPNDDYEIIVYNGGGESLERDRLKFFVKSRDKDTKQGINNNIEIIPYFVYSDTPQYCGSSFGGSAGFGNERWSSSDGWVSGQTLRFFISLPDGTEPMGIFAQYSPYTSNIVASDFSSYREKPAEWIVDKDFPHGDVPEKDLPPYSIGLIPILFDKNCPDGCSETDTCEATFMYISDADYTYPCNPGYSLWNMFSGTDVVACQGQTSDFKRDDSGIYKFKAHFSKDIVWKLYRTVSEKAICP